MSPENIFFWLTNEKKNLYLKSRTNNPNEREEKKTYDPANYQQRICKSHFKRQEITCRNQKRIIFPETILSSSEIQQHWIDVQVQKISYGPDCQSDQVSKKNRL